MRWLVIAGLALFAVAWAGRSACAQEEADHLDPGADVSAPADEAHEHGEDGAAADGAEHSEDDHAEHKPIYDGDHDDLDENYNKPPLWEELTAFRFLFALGMFVAFVFIMRRIAWRPLIAAFDAREARVNEAHAFVASSKAEIQDLIRQHEARISESYDEVKEIVAAARKEAEEAKAEIIAQAESEARDLQERSIAEIRAATGQALGELSGRVDEYTDMATEHVLGRALRN